MEFFDHVIKFKSYLKSNGARPPQADKSVTRAESKLSLDLCVIL
jgi:hypothetical protein